MTEKRKQELRQLLKEAMENLEIVSRFTYPPILLILININGTYGNPTSYSPNSAWFVKSL